MTRNGYIDSFENGSEIIVWERDKNRKLIRKAYQSSDYCYCYVPSNKEEVWDGFDIHGNKLRKMQFKNRFDLNQFARSRSNTVESDVPLKYRILQDEYSNCDASTPLNIIFYDIEVKFDLNDGLGYPEPSNPYGEINMFQLYDVAQKSYVLFTLTKDVVVEDEDEGIDVHVIDCSSEIELLRYVSEYLRDVDVMTGWNTEGFDIPYIMARSMILFGEDEALRMYCKEGYKARKREFIDEYGNEAISYELIGIQNIDMMQDYKKFIPSEKKSFALGAVTEEDLGITKEEYDGDLGSLFFENPRLFMKYGLRDVQLLKWLDEKHKIMDLVVKMTRDSCVMCRDATGSVKLIEYDLMKFCHKKNIMLPDHASNVKEKYDGAVVYDTISGRHGWSGSVDLRSLYPFCMILLGLSPETMRYQLKGEYEDYVHVITRDDSHVWWISMISKLARSTKVYHLRLWISLSLRDSQYLVLVLYSTAVLVYLLSMYRTVSHFVHTTRRKWLSAIMLVTRLVGICMISIRRLLRLPV